MTRPGETLRSIAQRFCGPATMERLIDPVIADLQCEHADAVVHRRVWHARWIRMAGYVAFWKVAAIGIGRVSTGALITPQDATIGRTIRFSGIATTVLTLVFMWPPVWTSFSHPGHRVAIFLALVPQAMSVALPMGIVFGVLCGLRGRVATTRVHRTIVGLTIVSSLVMIGIVGWVLPASNQVFREIAAGRAVARGMNELTLAELSSEQALGRRWVLGGTARRAFEFHFRLALGCAPLALGLFALGVATARRRASRIPTIGVIALASCFGYYWLLYVARQDVSVRAPAIVAAWVPNVVFLACGLLLWTTRRRGPSAADPSRRDGVLQSADRSAGLPT
jgi:hypothetical protein